MDPAARKAVASYKMTQMIERSADSHRTRRERLCGRSAQLRECQAVHSWHEQYLLQRSSVRVRHLSPPRELRSWWVAAEPREVDYSQSGSSCFCGLPGGSNADRGAADQLDHLELDDGHGEHDAHPEPIMLWQGCWREWVLVSRMDLLCHKLAGGLALSTLTHP